MPREERAITLDAGWQPPTVDPVAELAKQVRILYCICVREITNNPDYGKTEIPAWDGDPTGKTGRRTQNVWPKIAQTIVSVGADPFQFIRAQFYNVRRSKPPTPNQIFNAAAIARWEQFRLHARKELEQRVESDINQLQVHMLPLMVNLKWDRSKALNYAIRDQTCGASHLVRYCFAFEAQLPIAAELMERALLQYMFQVSDYDELLGARIPAELKTAATALRARLSYEA